MRSKDTDPRTVIVFPLSRTVTARSRKPIVSFDRPQAGSCRPQMG